MTSGRDDTGAALPPATRHALAAATFGTGMVYLDQSAINIALPAIRAGLGTDVSGMQWIVSLYVLFGSAPLLVCGVLGDRFGRVRFYIAGMSLFGAAGLVCGLAANLPMLLFARAVQGLGAAMMIAVGLAILNANTPQSMRGRVIGLWAGLTSVIIAIGPATGGVLVDLVSWRLVFVINAPFALAAVWIAWRHLPESRADETPLKTDLPGVALMLAGMAALLFALIEGPRLGWSAFDAAALAAGVALLVLFTVRQRTAASPLLPTHLFRHRAFTGINLVTMLQWIAISALFFFLPINLQQVQGFGATEAGLAVLPVSLCIMLLSRVSGRLVDRIGPLPLILAGIALIGVALGWFGSVGEVRGYARDLFAPILCFGAGLGLLIAPLTHVAMNALPDRYSGLASGVNNTASRLSNMLAIALLGSLMASQFSGALEAGIDELGLDRSVRQAVLVQAGNLADIEPPAVLDSPTRQAIRAVVAGAFFDAWRLVMWFGVAMCFVSALVAWLLLRDGRDE